MAILGNYNLPKLNKANTQPMNVNLFGGLGGALKKVGGVLNPKIPVDTSGKPVNAFQGLANTVIPSKIAPKDSGAVEAPGQKAASVTDNIKGNKTVLQPKFQAKTTGTQEGDIKAGLISGGVYGGTTKAEPKPEVIPPSDQPPVVPPAQSETVYRGSNQPFGGILGQLVSQGIMGSQGYNQSIQNLADFNRKLAQQYGSIEQTPIPLEFQQGRGQVLSRQAASEQAALQGAVQQQQTQQQQQLGALQAAAGLTQPVSQFGMLTNPLTGQTINPQMAQGFVGQAVDLVKNGASIDDPRVTALIQPLGAYGTALFNAAMSQGGTYNPTSLSTQVASNQQNLANFQNQSVGASQALQQIQQLEPFMLSFLTKSGVNPFDAQMYNGPVMEYLDKIGASGAASSWSATMNDLKNYTSQLLASGYVGTPTGNEAMTLSQDPSKLSYKQMQGYLQVLKDLGSNRLNVLQNNIKALGGSSSVYSGTPSQPVSSATVPGAGVSGFGTGITSPLGQFAAGGAASIVPGLAGAATQGGIFALGNKILNFLLPTKK